MTKTAKGAVEKPRQSRKGGRPTKYTDTVAQRLYESLAAGDSVTQFAASEGVSKSTVYLWAEQHPEFSDALTRGQEASQAYWEGQLREMMFSREVNAPLVKLYFANRFSWHDKSEVDNKSSDGTMTPKPTTIELVAPHEQGKA